MRKITSIFAACMVTALMVAQNPVVTTEWELSAATTSLPEWIGTTGTVRGMAFGTFESKKVVVVPTRTPSLAFKVIDASNGSLLSDLNVTGVSGGDVTVSDAAVTNDGKILAANVIVGNATTEKTLKVYRWDNSTDAPTVAISYPYTNTNRYGDHITVYGSIVDGTAKVYAASTVLSGGVASIICFSMVSDGSGGYVFNQTPAVVSSAVTATGSYATVEFLPNGSFFLKSNAQQIRKYNADGSYANDVSLSSVVATGGNSLKYLRTKSSNDGIEPDTSYVVYFRYGSGQERANILKLPGGSLAGAIVTNVTPALGTNSNAGGSGRVAVDITGTNDDYMYVLSTNNGIAKYKIAWPASPTTSTINPNDNIRLVAADGRIQVEGAEVSSIELYNTVGQKVKSVNGVNELSTSGLNGVYIVQVKSQDRVVKTAKISVR